MTHDNEIDSEPCHTEVGQERSRHSLANGGSRCKGNLDACSEDNRVSIQRVNRKNTRKSSLKWGYTRVRVCFTHFHSLWLPKCAISACAGMQDPQSRDQDQSLPPESVLQVTGIWAGAQLV